MKAGNKKIFILLLSLVVLCSGCRTSTDADIPQLIEPMATNSAYRPVERGNIGNIKILMGTVVPKKYCSFFETSVSISEITVEVGDYVKEGDIVAYANMDEAKKLLESLQEQLDYENTIFDLNASIAVETQNQLKYEKTDEDLSKKIAVCEENARYDRQLHQYRADKIQAEIDSVENVIKDGILRARHNGYITYVKNISDNPDALSFENIVIVSDINDIYIEVEDQTIDEYTYGNYETKYIKLAGNICDVEEITYSQAEMLQAKASGRYPNVRFECPDTDKMSIGDNCPIYFVKNYMEDVLIIGKDSLYSENEEYYVYVVKDENQKEKRYITIGKSDDYYVQVTGGLSENELVYYESDTRIPADYNIYEAELSDFEIKNYSKTYSLANTFSYHYRCEQEGRIVKMAVKEGENVVEGDLLYVIDIGEGKAALAEAQNNIHRENQTYEEQIKELNKKIKKASKKKDDVSKSEVKILQYQKRLVNIEHEYSLKQLQDIYDSINEGNDGEGNVSIYAEDSGMVEKVMAKEDERVMEGEKILSISTVSKDKLLVEMAPEKELTVYTGNIADVGEIVSIDVDGTIYTGKCIGWTVNSKNNEDENYVYSEDGNVYISYSTSSGYDNPAFYVEMDDSSFYRNMRKERKVTFSYRFMHDVITIPKGFVYTEEGDENKQDSYVWRVVEDELVKQYVLIDYELSDEDEVVVLSGIEAGDALATE